MSQYLFSIFEENGFHIDRLYVGKDSCRLVVKFYGEEFKNRYQKLNLSEDYLNALFRECIKIYGFELKNCHTVPAWYENYGVSEDVYISDLLIDLKDKEICFQRECFGTNVKSDLSYKSIPADNNATVKDKMVNEIKNMIKEDNYQKAKQYKMDLEKYTEYKKIKDIDRLEVKDRFDLLDMR